MKLSDKQKARIFDRIVQEYIQEHGLGGMSKGDLDALLLWLIAIEQEEIDSFALSAWFKVKETRVKSLLETAAVKFEETDAVAVWKDIIKFLSTVEFDVESLEKGQIRFQLSNPMRYRWIQKKVRELRSTCSYNRSAEQVTMNLDTMYQILDWLWEPKTVDEDRWTKSVAEQQHPRIQRTIGNIGRKIEANSLEDLRDRKRPKLRRAIQDAAALVGIGSQVGPLLERIGT